MFALPLEDQLAAIEKIQISSKSLFIVLLETITNLSYQHEILERSMQLVNNLAQKLDSLDYLFILEALIKLKFDSFSIDPFDYVSLFANFDATYLHNYFALVAIEVCRIEILKMALHHIKGFASAEIQNALLNTPEMLSRQIIQRNGKTDIWD